MTPGPSPLSAIPTPNGRFVALMWAPPAGTGQTLLFRDGELYQNFPGSTRTFVDRDVEPGETHGYSVGFILENTAVVEVTLPTPTPLALVP